METIFGEDYFILDSGSPLGTPCGEGRNDKSQLHLAEVLRFFLFFLSQFRRVRHYIVENSNSGRVFEVFMVGSDNLQTDKYYIARCLNGHSDDYRYLVGRYQAVLLAHLAGRLGSKDDAEEAAQEVFVRAYFGLSKLKKPASFFSWLLGIANRVAKEQQRERQRQQQRADSVTDKSAGVWAGHDFPLARTIGELPESYRELILLRYYAGHSCKDIAAQLDMPVGTVTKKLSRAYAMLRQRLAAGKFERSEK